MFCENTQAGTRSSGEFLSLFKPLTEFQEEEAEWLVPGWIPAQQITLLASDGGVGKTSTWVNIAAAISAGKPSILDEAGVKRKPEKVLFLTTEDSVRKKLLHKLRMEGADESNVVTMDCSADKDGLLNSLKFGSDALKTLIRTIKPALCIFDPIQGFVPPEVNMGARNQMRDCMAPLVGLGEETGTTFLIVCHTNKRKGAHGRDRISDSSDLWDISRSVIMAGFAGDGEQRYLSNEKNNYTQLQQTVLFSISQSGCLHREGTTCKRDRDFIAQQFDRQNKRQSKPLNEHLIEALKESASPFSPVRFSYDDFKAKHGDFIFGGDLPKRALDAVQPLLMDEGIYVKTGIHIKTKKTTQRGFSISVIDPDNEQMKM